MQPNKPLRLLCVLAHPDDESLGTGGILAKYAQEGVITHVLTATRGQVGWFGPPEENPGPEALGEIREKELYAAAEVLGLKSLTLLDFMDGQLDQAPSILVIGQIAALIRRIKPDVVVTFDPYGSYGHPDHIAISQYTTSAIMVAAAEHRVSKLYYLVETQDNFDVYQDVFGELVMHVDGVERRAEGWKDWAITTRISTGAYWQTVWNAIACHKSQLPGYESLRHLPPEKHQTLWAEQSFYRAFSLVNGGRTIETDLFEGLRHRPSIQLSA